MSKAPACRGFFCDVNHILSVNQSSRGALQIVKAECLKLCGTSHNAYNMYVAKMPCCCIAAFDKRLKKINFKLLFERKYSGEASDVGEVQHRYKQIFRREENFFDAEFACTRFVVSSRPCRSVAA